MTNLRVHDPAEAQTAADARHAAGAPPAADGGRSAIVTIDADNVTAAVHLAESARRKLHELDDPAGAVDDLIGAVSNLAVTLAQISRGIAQAHIAIANIRQT